MSGTMFAGHLCATHVGDQVKVNQDAGKLRTIVHRHDHPTVRLVIADWSGANTRILDVDPMTIVTTTNPTENT